MKSVKVNSNFEYLVPNSKMVVNIEKTILKHWLVNALKEGSQGISNVKCLVSDEKITMDASIKLERMFNPHFENYFEMTDQEIEMDDDLFAEN